LRAIHARYHKKRELEKKRKKEAEKKRTGAAKARTRLARLAATNAGPCTPVPASITSTD
jgi:hypothetical protein